MSDQSLYEEKPCRYFKKAGVLHGVHGVCANRVTLHPSFCNRKQYVHLACFQLMIMVKGVMIDKCFNTISISYYFLKSI